MIRYAIDPDSALALIRFEGDVTGADIVRAVRQMHREPSWHEGTDVLWVVHTADTVGIAPDEFEAILDVRTESTEGADLCIVDRKVDLAMMARLMNTLEERRGKTSKTFKTMAEALAWLGQEELPKRLREEIGGQK